MAVDLLAAARIRVAQGSVQPALGQPLSDRRGLPVVGRQSQKLLPERRNLGHCGAAVEQHEAEVLVRGGAVRGQRDGEPIVRDGFRGAGGFGWYGWAGIDARAVAHNIFLDGNTFEHSASVHRKRFGFDAQLGVALVWPSARIGFAFVQRSREFSGQDRPDRFGQLAVSFAF